MRKEGENLFKWLWREYTEFCDESGLSQPGACRRCVPLVKEDAFHQGRSAIGMAGSAAQAE